MQVKVDQDLCIGCGLCVQMCADVFEMDGDKAKAKAAEVPADAADSCKESADSCPVTAIIVE